MNYVVAIVVAYLLGSVPVSVVLSRALFRDDIRRHGSGNPGASNMTRTYGLGAGLLALLGDAGKGVLGALIGRWLCGELGLYACSVAAVLGHNWSVFMGFKGGKGVATSGGAVLVMNPWLTLACFGLFIIVTLLFRYFSLSSVMALLCFWIITLFTHFSDTAMVITVSILTFMSIARHWPNIQRLRNGTENRIEF